VNVLIGAVRGQFRPIRQSVAVEIRNGLRGRLELIGQWRGIQRETILSGIFRRTYLRGRRHYRYHEQKRQFFPEITFCSHPHCLISRTGQRLTA
jgi:hypothetical protein